MIEGCENAITRTGWGLCNYFIIGLCSMCTFAEAIASLIVVVLTPLLACDLTYNKQDIMTLNAVSSLGMALGGLLFGTLADNNGRKLLITSSMIIIFCSSIGLSFSQSYVLISLCIFVLGVGVSGNNAILRVYLIEFLPAKHRGSCIAGLNLVWIVGILSALGIAWSLVPSIIRMLENEFRPSSWRVLAGIGGAPSLIMACASSLLPASPRYLVYRRRPTQALSVLQQIYAINNSKHGDTFPRCNLERNVTTDDNLVEPINFFENIKWYFVKTWKRLVMIFSSRFIQNTLLLIVTRFLLFPGLIWMAIWNNHVYHVKNNMENITLTLNETCITDTGEIVMSFLHNCHVANNLFFEYSIILSSSFTLGECLLVLFVDKIGRRLSLITSGLIGTMSILVLTFLSHSVNRIVMSIIFLASYSVINTITTILLLENYPTAVRYVAPVFFYPRIQSPAWVKLERHWRINAFRRIFMDKNSFVACKMNFSGINRGTMMGLTSVLPHLLSFFIKFLIHLSCSTTLYTVSSLLIGATIAALPITDLTKAPMHE